MIEVKRFAQDDDLLIAVRASDAAEQQTYTLTIGADEVLVDTRANRIVAVVLAGCGNAAVAVHD